MATNPTLAERVAARAIAFARNAYDLSQPKAPEPAAPPVIVMPTPTQPAAMPAPPAVIEAMGVPVSSAPPLVVTPPLLKLDLGCGQTTPEGFTGVDVAELPGVVKFDLFDDAPWPWADSSVDELRASHFIEHLPMVFTGQGKDLLFHFFDEAWRVAKHGAVFHLIWPALKTTRAFMDPTHRRFIPQETLMLYLNPEWRKANQLDHYKVVCHWAMISGVPTIPNGPRFEGDTPLADRNDIAQRKAFTESWDTMHDFHVVLKAVKE